MPLTGYGGAIPRRSVISRDSSADSTASSIDAAVAAASVASMASVNSVTASMVSTKTCFCGHFTEVSTLLNYYTWSSHFVNFSIIVRFLQMLRSSYGGAIRPPIVRYLQTSKILIFYIYWYYRNMKVRPILVIYNIIFRRNIGHL